MADVFLTSFLCDIRRKVQGGDVQNEPARRLWTHGAPGAQLGRRLSAPRSPGVCLGVSNCRPVPAPLVML